MCIFIAAVCWVYLTPFVLFQVIMMNAGMKGMGLATALTLLYHHIIVVESCSNKDNRLSPFVLRDNNPTYLLFLYTLLLEYHVYLVIYIFLLPLAFIFWVESLNLIVWQLCLELYGSILGLRGTWGVIVASSYEVDWNDGWCRSRARGPYSPLYRQER